MRIAAPRAAAASEPAASRGWPGPLAWLPLLVIAAGLGFGVVMWAKWGFLIAFETLRSYCF